MMGGEFGKREKMSSFLNEQKEINERKDRTIEGFEFYVQKVFKRK